MKLNVLLAFTLVVLIACGGSKEAVNLTPEANENTVNDMPDWFIDTPSDPNYLFSPQTSTSRDIELSVKKATQSARADIAMQIEAKVDALEKQFSEEVGTGEDSEFLEQFTDVNKTVTSQTLYGAEVIKKEIKNEGSVYRAYVLMQMPIGILQEELVNEIKKQENLHTPLRASKSFQELEEEVAKKYGTEKQE
jgi:hypothetical protein